MTDAELFLNYIGKNYEEVKKMLKITANKKRQSLDEDIFHEAIVRVHKAIDKKGKMDDTSPYGMKSYLLRTYNNLVLEIKRASINKKRDLNYNSDNISTLHEDYANKNDTPTSDKIKSDLYTDFSCLYVLAKVEDNFPQEYFYLYRVKELCPNMTYKRLAEMTNIKGVRQKVVEVKNFLKKNVTKNEINDAFNKMYGDLC